MLSELEKNEIGEVLAHALPGQDMSIDVLAIVQKHRGWISDEAVIDISACLGTTPSNVDSVASFYNLIYRKPVGDHVILLCDSISCWVMGYPTIRGHIEKRLGITFGRTTADNRFTLLPVACLGACDLGPAMMIGETLFTKLDEEKIDHILKEHGWQP